PHASLPIPDPRTPSIEMWLLIGAGRTHPPLELLLERGKAVIIQLTVHERRAPEIVTRALQVERVVWPLFLQDGHGDVATSVLKRTRRAEQLELAAGVHAAPPD